MRVADGVFWLRMPIPIKGLDYINLWLLEDGDGWTVVDTGFRDPAIEELWQQLFDSHLAGRPLKRMICTHFHPDHTGLAGWLSDRTGAELTMTLGEFTFGRMLQLDKRETVPEEFLDYYRQLGFPPEWIEGLKERGFNHFSNATYPIPRCFRRIVDTEEFEIGGRTWRVMVGRGHSPEHACLYCPSLGLLISGDQILPKISPHIGVYPTEPDADPLRFYIDSLPLYRPLPADTLVLPAHNDPFRGLHARLDQLAHHHDDRLAALLTACDEPKPVLDLVPVIFKRPLNVANTFLASAETLAHLHYLMSDGRLERRLDGDGAYRYQTAAGASHAA